MTTQGALTAWSAGTSLSLGDTAGWDTDTKVIMTLSNTLSAESLISDLRADSRVNGLRILLGGRALAGTGELWKQLGADGHATSAESAISIGKKLVGISADD